MRILNAYSLRTKTIFLTVTVNFIAMIIGFTLLAMKNYSDLKRQSLSLSMQTANFVSVALAFDDVAAAKVSLSYLDKSENVKNAAFFDLSKKIRQLFYFRLYVVLC